LLGARRGIEFELPRADRELPRRPLRSRQGEGLLPREPALRALRARADADRDLLAAPSAGQADDDRAVPALEGLERAGAGVGDARDERVARLAPAPAGDAHVRLAPTRARALPGADRGAWAERPGGCRAADGQDRAPEKEEEAPAARAR